MAGISKLRPAGPFHPARETILSVRKKECRPIHEKCVDLIERNILKQSHYVRCPAGKLLCYSLISAVMNCCVVALSVFFSDILPWSADILVYSQCQGRTQGGGWIKIPS